MAVELPTTAEVRKARHDAAKTAAERAEVARTPLLAVLGAGDIAVSAVSRAVSELPQRLTSEELRKAVAELRTQAEHTYEGFARHGEQTWGRIRKQPQVKDALARIETVTGKLDARVDDLVDDARDATEKALGTVTTQTRSTGERVARATQRFTGRAAESVQEASQDASKAVSAAGTDAAEAISEAGADVAHETRSATRKAANRTAPKAEPKTEPKTAPKTAPEARTESKPAARRTGTTNGTKSDS